jgi:hypothetical protein
MKQAVLFLLLSGALMADSPGIRPRADAASYVVHTELQYRNIKRLVEIDYF